ncbi:hypothetical protein M5D96_003465 [Drosophila gunungcola]|uniref:Uncharacterized protein n=1 Tax=Drosophila gunungcola TaxID=103775 RepID=A0A9P9YSN1_9MUSC|nr:hypothetical protein M5D96_003465 [Drosophila gunungcola]
MRLVPTSRQNSDACTGHRISIRNHLIRDSIEPTNLPINGKNCAPNGFNCRVSRFGRWAWRVWPLRPDICINLN